MEKQLNHAEFLREFYRTRGISERDLSGRLKAIQEYVAIPNFPSDRTPTLCELEAQYLIDNGFKL